MIKSFFHFILIAFLLCGCSFQPREMEKDELLNYLADPANGLTVEKDVEVYHWKVSHVPGGLIALQRYNAKNNTLTMKELLQEQEGMVYFTVKISDDNREVLGRFVKERDKYDRLAKNLSYDMDKYTYFRTPDRDSIPLHSFHSPMTYGMSTHTKLLFAAHVPEMEHVEWVELMINEFGLNTGLQHFRFKTAAIKKIPSLKYNREKDEQT
jgi:hypothetical protein